MAAAAAAVEDAGARDERASGFRYSRRAPSISAARALTRFVTRAKGIGRLGSNRTTVLDVSYASSCAACAFSTVPYMTYKET